MNLEIKKKQYGLILNKKGEPVTTNKRLIAAAFADSDDDDSVDVSGKNRSASSIRVIKEAERAHERALAEDPSIFDYDASYDAIQEKKNEKIAEQKKKDTERKSKYAEDIIQAHARRELEKLSRDERKQVKEREQEGDEFADKEVFITNTYKQKMEEVQVHREAEEYEDRFNAATSVENQQLWQSGFSRNILSSLARDGEPTKTAVKKEPIGLEDKEDKTTASKLSKLKNMRKRMDSRTPSPEPSHPQREIKKEPKEKKSIYDSDQSEDEASPIRPMGLSKQGKNFEGELKPGLNKVERPPADVKVMTKAERLRRAFTPTSSEDEREELRERNDNDDRRERRRDDRDRRADDGHRDRSRDRRDSRRRRDSEKEKGVDSDEKSSKSKEEKKPEKKKDTPAERLSRIKAILKQRNGPAEIDEFRMRYLERREQGIVVPPI